MELGKRWKGGFVGTSGRFSPGCHMEGPTRSSIFRHQGPDWPCEGGEIIKLSIYQISKLTKSRLVDLGKNGTGREIIGTSAGFSQGSHMATVPTDRRFFYIKGQWARQGGNYQIIKISN